MEALGAWRWAQQAAAKELGGPRGLLGTPKRGPFDSALSGGVPEVQAKAERRYLDGKGRKVGGRSVGTPAPHLKLLAQLRPLLARLDTCSIDAH